jgi:hypothetical protein
VLATTAATSGKAAAPLRAPTSVWTSVGGPGYAPGIPAWVKAQEMANLRRFQSRHLSSATYFCSNPQPYWKGYTFRNVTHTAVLWRYIEQLYYCTALGYVTYFYRARWAEMSSIVPIVGWNPWEFVGNIPSGDDCATEHCLTPNTIAQKRYAITHGAFRVCLAKFLGLCNHVKVIVKITLYGNGQVEGSSGQL